MIFMGFYQSVLQSVLHPVTVFWIYFEGFLLSGKPLICWFDQLIAALQQSVSEQIKLNTTEEAQCEKVGH